MRSLTKFSIHLIYREFLIKKPHLWSPLHAPCYLELNSTFPSSRPSRCCGYTRSKPHSAPGAAASRVPGAAFTVPSTHSERRKRCCIQATRGNISTAKEVEAGSATRSVATEISPSPPPPASSWVYRHSREQESQCGRQRGAFVPLTVNDSCFYLRYQKHILELHPWAAQRGLQVSKRSLILNTTVDLFLFKWTNNKT